MNDPTLTFMLMHLSKQLKQRIKQDIQQDNNPIPFELLSHLDRHGKTLKELTQLMQCSKQEVSRQVKRAEEHGWITLQADEHDGRSKRVHYSTEGKKQLKQGLQYYQALENEWQEALGIKKLQQLKRLLTELDTLI